MKTYAKRPWHLRWWTDRLVRHRIRAFVRRCAHNSVFKSPVLDAGCGYRSSFPEVWCDRSRHEERLLVRDYKTLDSNPDLNPDYVGDICNMSMIESGQFGSVICTEVLEHVRDPAAALYEMFRVLKPGGTIVVTVPFWYPVHSKPYQQDYWRFTAEGLRVLMEEAGFWDIHIQTGGRKLKPTGVFAYGMK